MPPKNIITGQKISPNMHNRARQMRHSMTPSEQKLWQRLRAGRLEGFHFRRQQIIDNYIVDFFCHQTGLVVELDGSGHLGQAEYDRTRDAYLKERCLRVLRFFLLFCRSRYRDRVGSDPGRMSFNRWRTGG